MKYLILGTTLIVTSTCSIIAMESEHQARTGQIRNIDRQRLSITLINQSGIPLWIEIGDLSRDEIRCRKAFRSEEKFTLFPYSKSFYRKDEYPENGPRIKLFMAYPEENIKNIPLLITKDSEIKFGDTALITYTDNTLHIIRDTNNHSNLTCTTSNNLNPAHDINNNPKTILRTFRTIQRLPTK